MFRFVISRCENTILFADSLKGLQQLIEGISQCSQRYIIDMNNKKTKFMVISKRRIDSREL